LTERPLTERGEAQVKATAAVLVGTGRLIDPHKLGHIFSSPRTRAIRTCELALGSVKNDHDLVYDFTEELAEWDYGSYEGLTSNEIRALRKSRELDTGRGWSIWIDGAEGGE
jgi:broad specificity phosphatase PhoE